MMRRAMMGAAFSLLLLCGGCETLTGGPRYSLDDLALSPDGHLVAVRFTDHDNKHGGLGLYDWQKGRFTPIHNPQPGRSFVDPSFSQDGKRLVAVSNNQIVVIDVATLAVTKVTEGGQGFKEAPVFQPNSNRVLYVANNPARLVLLDLDSRTETPVLDAHDGFGSISRPYFGGPDRIIFLATGPKDYDLQEQVAAFPDSRPDTDTHFYGLKFGARPDLILKNLWIEGKKRSRWFTGQKAMQASQDALTIAYIDIAENEKAGPERNVDQEIFAIENGAVRQLTHLHMPLAAAAISYDGATIAFAADSSHDGSFDLSILDVKSGKIRSAGVLRSIRSGD